MERHKLSGHHNADGPRLVAQVTGARNGLARKPYVPAHAADAERAREIDAQLAAVRATLAARRGVAVADASPADEPFTPGPEWYRELDDWPVPAPEPELAPWDKPRCDRCGYVLARCACPGGA